MLRLYNGGFYQWHSTREYSVCEHRMFFSKSICLQNRGAADRDFLHLTAYMRQTLYFHRSEDYLTTHVYIDDEAIFSLMALFRYTLAGNV